MFLQNWYTRETSLLFTGRPQAHGAWISVEKMWTQNTCIIHDVWRLLILSNEEKTNYYENFEKGMIYMKILKKKGGGSREKGGRGNEIHAPCACALL
jgi:hypothetical protein